MRHMFTTAAVMMAVMPAFFAGIALAASLGFRDGDEGKTMSIATAFAFLVAVATALAAPKGLRASLCAGNPLLQYSVSPLPCQYFSPSSR